MPGFESHYKQLSAPDSLDGINPKLLLLYRNTLVPQNLRKFYKNKLIHLYHDVLPSILAECPGERWTGFGLQLQVASAASVWAQ
jgi:hypothetical protein